MELSTSTLAAIIALLVSASATYNAYVLRGGRLAWSQVLTALGTISLMFSLVLPQSGFAVSELRQTKILGGSIVDLLFILGFVLLFAGSLRLRYSLK